MERIAIGSRSLMPEAHKFPKIQSPSWPLGTYMIYPSNPPKYSQLSISDMEKMEGKTLGFLKVLLLICVCMGFQSIEAKPVKYCDRKGDNYAVKVKGVEISPDPVSPGKAATFSISASTGTDLSGGNVVIDVSYFGVHVHTETHDLCEETSCPISSGDFVLSHTQTLPGFTPPGSYTLRMKVADENKHQLTCITFNFKIGFGSSVADS